jgi:hypothetical protein
LSRAQIEANTGNIEPASDFAELVPLLGQAFAELATFLTKA